MDELLIAFAILITPCDPTETYQDFDTPIVRMAMNQWSVELELIDKNSDVFYDPTEPSGCEPYEQHKYVFNGFEWQSVAINDFDSSVQLLQTIHKNVENYPKVFESGLFPDRKFVLDALSCNRVHRNLINDLKAVYPIWRHDVLNDTYRELIELDRIWTFLLYIDQESSVTHQRYMLNELKNVIGAENYYSGRMPPAIPVWRFPANE